MGKWHVEIFSLTYTGLRSPRVDYYSIHSFYSTQNLQLQPQLSFMVTSAQLFLCSSAERGREIAPLFSSMARQERCSHAMVRLTLLVPEVEEGHEIFLPSGSSPFLVQLLRVQARNPISTCAEGKQLPRSSFTVLPTSQTTSVLVARAGHFPDSAGHTEPSRQPHYMVMPQVKLCSLFSDIFCIPLSTAREGRIASQSWKDARGGNHRGVGFILLP